MGRRRIGDENIRRKEIKGEREKGRIEKRNEEEDR